LVLPGLVALLVLLSPAFARADAITTLAVSGTAQNISGTKLDSCANGATCAFSGTFQVDTTSGSLETSGFAITLPGLPAFNSPFGSDPVDLTSFWEIFVHNGSGDTLHFVFSTAHIPASLKGFTGGSFFGGDAQPFYTISSGSITLAPVPEPSSLVLFASGMLVLGLTWRFGKKAAHPLSA